MQTRNGPVQVADDFGERGIGRQGGRLLLLRKQGEHVRLERTAGKRRDREKEKDAHHQEFAACPPGTGESQTLLGDLYPGGRGWTNGKPRIENHRGFAKPPAPATLRDRLAQK